MLPTSHEALRNSGGPEASAVFDRYWERLRLFALRRVGALDAAEDAAQETLTRVFEALREGRVRDHDALPAFVFQTARHVCAHWHRKGARGARALEHLRHQPTDRSSTPDALTVVVAQERRALMRGAFARLGHEDGSLLRALFYEGKNAPDLAREMGITPGALRVRKHRALQRLRDLCAETFSSDR